MTSKKYNFDISGMQVNSEMPRINDVHLLAAASIPPLQIDWLWNGWLAAGKFHILAGAPGTGKTTLTMHFIAAISNGSSGRYFWPDKSPTPSGNVIIWSGADCIQDTITPRLVATGANLNRVHIIHETG